MDGDGRWEREPGPAGWVVLRDLQDPVEAELITGLLKSGGIEAQTESRVFTQEPVPAVRSMSRVLVWVPVAEREQAERVLSESESAATPCPQCGHVMEEGVCSYCAGESNSEAEPPGR